MPGKQSRESKRAIVKRVLEAQKVVLSEMLYRWQKDHGMAYAIVVWNEEGDVFIRSRVDNEKQWPEMHTAVQTLLHKMEGQQELPFRLERSKVRNEG